MSYTTKAESGSKAFIYAIQLIVLFVIYGCAEELERTYQSMPTAVFKYVVNAERNGAKRGRL